MHYANKAKRLLLLLNNAFEILLWCFYACMIIIITHFYFTDYIVETNSTSPGFGLQIENGHGFLNTFYAEIHNNYSE